MLDDAFWSGEDVRPSAALPGTASGTLDTIAEALGITTALLHQPAGAREPRDGPASLLEASTLLRDFIRIPDRQTRRRCLAFVRDAAQSVSRTASKEGDDA